jgi:lysophospholipase L1-like esterase
MKKLAFALLLALCASAQTTTWFGPTNAYIIYGGAVGASTAGGRSVAVISGVNGQAQFTAAGTAISLSVYPTTTTGCTFSVDGTATTPTLTAATWQVTSILSGGVDTPHTIIITGTNTCYLDKSAVTGSTGFVELTGSAPTLNYAAAFGPVVYTTTTILPANVTSDGTMYANSSSTGLYSSGNVDAQIRFRATCTDIWIWAYQTTAVSYNLFINRVPGATTAMGSSGWGWVHVATGLNAAAEAEYLITFPNAQQQGVLEIMAGGGTFNNSFLPPHRSYVAFGDSITQATGGSTIQDSTYGYPRLTGQGLAYGLLNMGQNGAHVVGTTGSALDYRTGYITSQFAPNGASIGSGQAPSIVSILGGVNDIGTSSPAVFQASYQDMLYKLVFGMPASTVFYCWDVLDTGYATVAQIAPFRAAVQQAVASMQSPHVIHVLTAGWWYPYLQATAVGTDLHPNVSGYATIEQKWLPTVLQAPLIPVAAMGW